MIFPRKTAPSPQISPYDAPAPRFHFPSSHPSLLTVSAPYPHRRTLPSPSHPVRFHFPSPRPSLPTFAITPAFFSCTPRFPFTIPPLPQRFLFPSPCLCFSLIPAPCPPRHSPHPSLLPSPPLPHRRSCPPRRTLTSSSLPASAPTLTTPLSLPLLPSPPHQSFSRFPLCTTRRTLRPPPYLHPFLLLALILSFSSPSISLPSADS